MSPGSSQGGLEVERYIGSCLISRHHSSSARNKAGGNGLAKKSPVSNVSNNGNHSVSTSPTGGGQGPRATPHVVSISSGKGGSNGEKQNNKRCTVHTRSAPGSFSNQISSPVLPACECTATPGYKLGMGSATFTPDLRNGWAGMPLISMAASRRGNSKKTGQQVDTRMVNKIPPHSPPLKAQDVTSEIPVENGSQVNPKPRTPLSRLAIHTQGAPLIFSGRFNGNRNKKNVSHQTASPEPSLSPARLLRGGDLVLPHRSAVLVKGRHLTEQQNANKINSQQIQQHPHHSGDSSDRVETSSQSVTVHTNNATPSNSDCLSIASDESSGHSENSLPRIIKPRKRRKKDRKPNVISEQPCQPHATAVVALKNVSPEQVITNSRHPHVNYRQYSQRPSSIDHNGIVTLKPYTPLCYDLIERSKCTSSALLSVSTVLLKEVEDKAVQNTDELGKESEENKNSYWPPPTSVPPGAAYPYPPSHLCQCRYCDGAGMSWDVSLNFLTPPPSPGGSPLFMPYQIPTENNIHRHDNENILADSDAVDDRLENAVNCSSAVGAHRELRRSRSEPANRKAILQPADCPTSCTAVVFTSTATSTTQASSGSIVLRSQSLEVSTEIVSSHYGHRDIEIKFFSTPAASNPVDSNPASSGAGGDVGEVTDVKSDEVTTSNDFEKLNGSVHNESKESEENINEE